VPSCICREGFIGDGKSTCEVVSVSLPLPDTVTTPTIKKVDLGASCNSTKECSAVYSSSKSGRCSCNSGFIQRKKKFLNIDECKLGYPNECDFYAKCIDQIGTYDCECRDGFQDSKSENRLGRVCKQVNECLDGTHDCHPDEVCIDRRPPLKWECAEKTPAPTCAPTRPPTPSPISLQANAYPWPYLPTDVILYVTQSGVTHEVPWGDGCETISDDGLNGCSGNSVKVTGNLIPCAHCIFYGEATLQIQLAPKNILHEACPLLNLEIPCPIDDTYFCDDLLDCT
jgi:Calcium-binding EGF domain